MNCYIRLMCFLECEKSIRAVRCVTCISSLRTRLPGHGNDMNSGERAQWCLEVVSGWIRNVQRGETGDEARMVG